MNEAEKYPQSTPTPETLSDEVAPISNHNLPMPHRADTFTRPLSEADEAALAKRRAFADQQAAEANTELAWLHELETEPEANDWAEMYRTITQWRSNLDAARLGKGIAQSKDRITTPITDASPNRDRIGDLGRLRAGSEWSDDAQAWIGGEPTPASQVVAEAGERALARFEDEGVEGDILQNWVRLPDGTMIAGNQIIKGEAAQQLALELKQGVANRNIDVSQFETGGDMVFMVTASEANRAAILHAAMQELERVSKTPQDWTEETFANIAYLLFQSPQYKKGSDAVIRTFLVTAGAYLGNTPTLLQDIDLRAGTMTQNSFVQHILESRK